nr:MAG TPA: hypothetical protein [Caudoviricetes sp.]
MSSKFIQIPLSNIIVSNLGFEPIKRPISLLI